MDYKAEITLNEKDSLVDMLTMEKTLVKTYAFAITESVSKGFRTMVKTHFSESASDQFDVFSMMTENGYYKVQSAPETQLKEGKNKFMKIKGELN